MNTIKMFSVVLLFIVFCNLLNAQPFIQKKQGQALTFKEMQLQFSDWSQNKDLKNTRYWKYFKRWENDMQMHTNAKGELADPSIYINECVKAANEKQIIKSNKFLSSAWSPTGPFAVPDNLTGYMENGIGRINCIAFHPTDPNTYFIGVAQGGVWKTTNNGLSWTPLTDNLPILRISDICIDPNDVNTMYISVCDFEYIDVALNIDGRKRNTHYGLGVYKTTDGGTSWQPTGLSFQLTQGDASLIRKIIVNPANSNQLVAAGVSGIYKSGNGGTSWTQVHDSLFWDLVQDPIVPSTLYAASGWLFSSNYGYAAIYKSTDFGLTWTELNTGIPPTGLVQRIKLAIAPSDHTCIYAMCVDANEGSYGIYKSIDSGNNWNYINSGLNVLESNDGYGSGGQGTYDLGFAINATDKNILYVGGINVWVSADGGQNFDPASHWTLYYGPTLHGDIHFIEVQPVTGDIFVCNDGGLYKTSNLISQTWADAQNGNLWPTQWSNISNGMQVTSFYRLSSSKNTTGRLMAGAQDNASFYFDGLTWHTIFGGDGMDNYLDPVDDNSVLGSSQYGNFYLSNDGGYSGSNINANVNSESSEWVSPIVADYNLPGTLFVGCTNVNRSDDNGNSWYSLTALPSNGIHDNEVSALAVANTNGLMLYAARRIRYEYGSPAGMYNSADGGFSWNDITAGLPDSLYITSVDVSKSDENTAFVSFAGFSNGLKVFKTTNAGITWQNISYNLPNIPINCIKTLSSTDNLIIATDIGVYVFDHLSNIWVNMSVGLPNVIVSDIEFNEALNKMYVSTFGRGIWETEFNPFVKTPELKQTEININLFPSLNNGTFTIKLETKEFDNEKLNLEVIDITGKKAYKTVLEGKTEYQIKLNLLSGMYFAKISNNKISGVKNFIVE